MTSLRKGISKKEDIIADYLLENVKFGDYVKKNHFIMQDVSVFKTQLEKIFNCKIPNDLYNQVIYGEGSEGTKINAVYSSSLQSLLFFSQVSIDTPLEIDGIKYTNVTFEYKNKVIGYPSSVDVVLFDDGKNILFIESKLAEIIRDSNSKNELIDDGEEIGQYVVGQSYFKLKAANGYAKALEIKTDKDLKSIGIYSNKIKNGNSIITKVGENEYVYSYGIKQLLSHLIGIKNFANANNDRDKRCSTSLNRYREYANVSLMEVYNALPNIYDDKTETERFLKPQDDFKEHIRKVNDELAPKGLFIRENTAKINIITKNYQEIIKNNPQYKKALSEEIIKFYHL